MTTFYCVLDQVAFLDCNAPCGDRSETITGETLLELVNRGWCINIGRPLSMTKAVNEYDRL